MSSNAHRAMQRPSATDIRPRGTVARFNTARHFGLIQPQTGGRTDDDLIFVHASDVVPRGDLRRGQLVSFELEQRPGGAWRAVRVTVIDGTGTTE